MATYLTLLFLASLLITLISSVSAIDARFSTSTTTTASPPPPPPPPPFSFLHDLLKPPSPFTTLSPVLTDLGYHDLAMAAHSLSLSASGIPWLGPTTVFAPADSSVRTCPSCSLSLLLQEHTVPGLYPLSYLRTLAFGTRIETILPGRCLTVTSAGNASKIFIGGAEITSPDLFSNGHVLVHGVQGFVSLLSPYSCSIDKLTSLSLPQQSQELVQTRMMLADAMVRLRTSGYTILSLAIRVKYHELVSLHNMTVFALDDAAIFHGGHSYIHDVKFHIVPNQLLKLADLESLPAASVLPTLLPGETLTVTTAGGGGVLSPMRINYVRIRTPDMMFNMKMVVHGLSLPFPHLRQSLAVSGRSGFHHGGAGDQFGSVVDDLSRQSAAPSPVKASTVEIDYDLGLWFFLLC